MEKTAVQDEPAGLDVPALDGDLAEVNRLLRMEIEARIAAEESLAASERKYRAMVHSAVDGICILQEQVLSYVNPRLCEMLERDQDALIGTSLAEHIAEDQVDRTLGLYRRMAKRDVFPQRYETVLVSKGGQRVDVAVSASAIDIDGFPSVVVIVRDIASQKRARQIAIENERLEAVRTVAHGISNNFSNILSVISSYAASIADSFLPNTRPHESARKILEAVSHATDLTRRLLGLVRVSPDAGLQLSAVDVATSVSKACELIAPTLRERDIVVDVNAAVPNLYIQADAGPFLDVLMNIFLNGADAMPQGGRLDVQILLQERQQATHTLPPGVADGDYVDVSVSDSGIGMTPEQLAHVFEPFYTTKADRECFGLGLPVAQRMIQSWGGWIEVRSTPGEGTCMQLIIPRAAAPHPASHDTPDHARTVLVVDDHAGRRRMMRRVLMTDGCIVLEAETGVQAIELYRNRSQDIDLAVIDWIMPGVDGRDVLQVIHEGSPEIPILMLSGFSRDYVRSQVRIGAWALLQKPFSTPQFRAAVHKLLD